MPPAKPPLPAAKPRSGLPPAGQEPFRNAEQAWFWTCNSLRARRDGARCEGTATERPCEPDDVLRALDRLYRHRRIDLGHARVLRIWGERQSAPDLRSAREHTAAVLWREALDRLAPPLRAKGIITMTEA